MDQTMQEHSALLNDLHTELHAEHKHLTTKAVAIEHSIPRSIAASLLEAVLYFNLPLDGCSYEVTRCVFEKVGDTFVAKLRTNVEIIHKGDQPSTQKHKIHSIALKTPHGTSSMLAAHIQTMSLLNDHQDTVLDPSIACDEITPALEVELVDKETLRNRRISGNGGGAGPRCKAEVGTKSKSKATAKPTTRPSVPAKRKTTSAASFFKSEPTSSSSSPPKKKKEKPAADIVTSKATAKTTRQSAKTLKKEKKVIEKVSEKKKGNADDFVGDMDEDEDFLKEEEERKQRNAVDAEKRSKELKAKEEKLKKRVVRKPMPRDDLVSADDNEMDTDDNNANATANNDDDDKEMETVHGAMDSFATKTKVKKNMQSENKGRKRRKQVLEEKTFVDENGFFRTETVSVWKEIEDDAEDAAEGADGKKKHGRSTRTISDKKPVAKPKPKNTKKMKQQGLAGFFSKKS